MRALIIHAGHNTTKPDATGAFIPEARAYAKWLRSRVVESPDPLTGEPLYTPWDVVVNPFDNRAPKAARRSEVQQRITGQGFGYTWDHFAFFGHGLFRGIQSGHDLVTAGDLADALATGAPKHLVVTLYACDAGDTPRKNSPGGDGGFADALRDALSERGITGHVDAHVTTGHTTRNPYVRRFYMDGAAAGTGGDWLVAPGSPKWRKWITALKGDMRWRFPWLTAAEIDAAL